MLKLWTFLDLSISFVAWRALTSQSIHREADVGLGKQDMQTGEEKFMGRGSEKQRLTSTETVRDTVFRSKNLTQSFDLKPKKENGGHKPYWQ